MKKRRHYILLLLIFISFIGRSQNTVHVPNFEIIHIYDADDSLLRDFKRKASKTANVLFEDSDFSVRATCSGEWGGAVWFTDKKTDIETSCKATCPIIVNKMDSAYYITSSLSHLDGHFSISRINNPTEMEIFEMPPPLNKKGKRKKKRKKRKKPMVYQVGDNESKSKIGCEELYSTYSSTALTSFVFKENLYTIFNDVDWGTRNTEENRHHGTFISSIDFEDVKSHQQLSEKRFSRSRKYRVLSEGEKQSVYFYTKDEEGFIEIEGNEVRVFYFEK